jgi:transcription elongation factor SPT6
MSMRDLIDGQVEVDDEENDDSFDEETGEVRPRKAAQNGHIDDSSEEEDDDDDEEAARAVSFQSVAGIVCPIADFLLGPRGFYHR